MQISKPLIPFVALIFGVTACSSNSTPTVTPSSSAPYATATPSTSTTPSTNDFTGGIFATDNFVATIGSTIDPINGDRNPYGLTVSKVTAGSIKTGDLVVCNFSNSTAGDQGHGTTIEVLHPVAGATPIHLAQDPSLEGCDALDLAANGNPWVAAYQANDNPVLTPAGAIKNPLTAGAAGSFAWHGPWGQIFANTPSPVAPGKTAQFFETNANDGSIVRINLPAPFTYQTIVAGLSVNHGVPGSILAPAGLTYDQSSDTLYVVDSNANRVLAFSHVSQIADGGITAVGTGFTGPFASSARVVYSGPPLNAPISSAELSNGDLLVADTGDNVIHEISPSSGSIVGHGTVDTGAAAAIFGMATTVSNGQQLVYFNDDNDNTVKVIQPGSAGSGPTYRHLKKTSH